MTQLESGPPTPDTPGATPRLLRSRDDRMVAGVCGGLGDYFGVETVWFRLGFVVTTLLGGSGAIIYLVAWIVIPEEAPGERTAAASEGIGGAGPMIVGIALVGIGLMLLANTFIPWFDEVVWPLALVIAGAGIIYLGTRRVHR